MMASLLCQSTTNVRIPLLPANRCSSSSSSSSLMASATTFGSPLNNRLPQWKKNKNKTTLIQTPMKRSSHVVCMAPDEERMTRRSPLEFPLEWEPTKYGRRPDVVPQFSPMKTPLPPPLPADPPEEDEFEEKEGEEGEEGEENPGNDNPEPGMD